MQRLLFIICLFSIPALGAAQEKIVNDTAAIELRKFSTSAIQNYKADPIFQYDRVFEPPRSLWNRFWSWLWEKIREMLDSENGSSIFFISLIIISAAILLFFILKLTGMKRAGLFGKENRTNGDGYSLIDDDIHAIDFEAAIQQAANDRNFRLAVRLLYLQSLKKLTDLGLINWQINKTNIAYAHELAGSSFHQHFVKLTYQFENNWYGDLPIDENEFRAVREQFTIFNKQLN